MSDLDRTHDPATASWVASANDPQTDFPIRGETSRPARIGVAIGDGILDLTACASDGLLLSLDDDLVARLGGVTLNRLMERGRDASRALRLAISEHTVKFHVGAILGKLGAASRTEAVMLAARQGLLML